MNHKQMLCPVELCYHCARRPGRAHIQCDLTCALGNFVLSTPAATTVPIQIHAGRHEGRLHHQLHPRLARSIMPQTPVHDSAFTNKKGCQYCHAATPPTQPP